MKGFNYLPFARREVLTLPVNQDGGDTGAAGTVTTKLNFLSTGGIRNAIIEDVIIYEGDDTTTSPRSYTTFGNTILARFGVDGKNFLTEHLYDYRTFTDKHCPTAACWDWSMGGRYPYRIFPGEAMKAYLGRCPSVKNDQSVTSDIRAVMFSGVHVNNLEPYMLYQMHKEDEQNDNANTEDLILLTSRHLTCAKDSPIDLYSVSVPEWYSNLGDYSIYVQPLDANDRPFWPDRYWAHILDPQISPIGFGEAGFKVPADETFIVELQNGNLALAGYEQTITVTIRGVIEVRDDRVK